MFIEYKDITNEILIDVRTVTEYNNYSICNKNIPIIYESDHKRLKIFYPSALFIILYRLIKNKKEVKSLLLKYTNNGNNKAIIACSRGRLRSPLMYFYAKCLGIDCKVLSRGVKGVIKNEQISKNSCANS